MREKLRQRTMNAVGVVLAALSLGVAQASTAERQAHPSKGCDGSRILPPGSPDRFAGSVDVVALDVSVEADGAFVPGLGPEEFLILDANVPRPVSVFAAEPRTPLAVSLLIDRSRSMGGGRLEAAKTAAAAFLASLGQDDMAEVMAFNERVSRLAPLSADPTLDQGPIQELSADGMTGLFEAVLVGLQGLERAERSWATDRLKALVILSDGDDNSSVVGFDDVLDAARRSGALIYSISLATDDRQQWLPPSHELVRLAHDSGGRAVSVRSDANLTSIYQEIAAEMQHLYRIGFVPAPGTRDGKWHALSVRVPGRDVRVRARSGYYAPACDADGPR